MSTPTLGDAQASLVVLQSDEALTTRGDLIVFDGSIGKRVAVGANGTALTADSGMPTGVSWQTPTGGGGPHAASHQNGGNDEINVAGLSGVLADPQTPIAHTHPQSDVTGLTSDLAGKASLTHSHSESDVTGLTGDLANKASLTHVHGATDITSGTMATARLGSGTADSTTFLRGDQTWAAPGGGSDPWTYKRVTGISFTTTSATAVDVTGLSFTPAANTSYEFYGVLRIQTVTATVNPRVGLAWPTGMSDGVAMIAEAQAVNTVPIAANGNISAALLIAVGGLPAANASQMALIQGMVEAGASPASSLRVQLASETAGTAVRVMRSSFLRYRSLP